MKKEDFDRLLEMRKEFNDDYRKSKISVKLYNILCYSISIVAFTFALFFLQKCV